MTANDQNQIVLNKFKELKPSVGEFRLIQRKAIEKGLLSSNDNFVIIGPTASGKTLVGELAALKEILEEHKVLYLVPLAQLGTEKEHELAYLEKKTRKSRTGEPEIKDKNVSVMTFETFYRMAIKRPQTIANYSLAIVDEFHLLYDKMRGFNLEKALTLLKTSGVRIVCLSATFEDRAEVTNWLHAKLVEVADTERPTKIHQKVLDLSHVKNSTKQLDEIIKLLLQQDKKPWLIFCSTKESTKTRALALRQKMTNPLLRPEDVKKQFAKLIGRRINATEEALAECVANRVGFFHSGVDQELKEFVFDFFNKGNIEYLFTTTGLAYGVNTPTKSVLLADIHLYEDEQMKPIEVYLYLQMAGRAGRIQGRGDGFCYIVAKKTSDREREIPRYLNGKIEKATSRINEDDYFRKCIIELVYSNLSTQQDILTFFKNTYYHFQSENRPSPFGKYDLSKIIADHISYLETKKFLKSMGAPGYKLTELGQVVAEYLFTSFQDHKLEAFRRLDEYLEKEKILSGGGKLIYELVKMFEGLRVSKIPREKSPIIESEFESRVDDVGPAEYTAYSLTRGWMINEDLADIEQKYKVNSAEIPLRADDIAKILAVAHKIAMKKGIEITKGFEDFITTVKYGVKEEEVPFVRIRGMGRESCRAVSTFMENFKKVKKLRGATMIEAMREFCEQENPDKFLQILKDEVPLIGDVKAKNIVNLVTKTTPVAGKKSEFF